MPTGSVNFPSRIAESPNGVYSSTAPSDSKKDVYITAYDSQGPLTSLKAQKRIPLVCQLKTPTKRQQDEVI